MASKAKQGKAEQSKAKQSKAKQSLGGIISTLLAVGILLVMTEKSAQAYTDPGSGVLIVQALFAGCVGCLFYLRRLVKWFKGMRSKD